MPRECRHINELINSYMSAYHVPDGLIGKFEALIVRSFANDLLNVKMENF